MHHNYIDMQGKCNKIRIPKQVKNYQLYPTYDFQHARYNLFMSTCDTILSTCNLFNMQLIYVEIRHIYVDIQLFYVNINKLHR